MSSCDSDDEISVWHLRALLDMALDALGEMTEANHRRQEMRALAALEAASRHLAEIEARHEWAIAEDEPPAELPERVQP